MPDELKKALTDFVIRALDAAQQVATDQLPLILQDIVRYQIWDGEFGAVLGLVFILVSLGMLWVGYVRGKAKQSYNDMAIPILNILGIIGVIVGGIMVCCGVYQYTYASNFPRLVVIDYLKGLL